MYDSEVMCRKEVDTPWSIYQDLTVCPFGITFNHSLIQLSDQDLRGLLKDLRSAASIHYEPAVMSAYPALKSFLDSSRIPFNIHDMQMDIGQALREFSSRQGKSNAVILTALQTRQPRAISKRDTPEVVAPLSDARNYTDVTGIIN